MSSAKRRSNQGGTAFPKANPLFETSHRPSSIASCSLSFIRLVYGDTWAGKTDGVVNVAGNKQGEFSNAFWRRHEVYHLTYRSPQQFPLPFDALQQPECVWGDPGDVELTSFAQQVCQGEKRIIDEHHHQVELQWVCNNMNCFHFKIAE